MTYDPTSGEHEPEVVYVEELFRHLVNDHGCGTANGVMQAAMAGVTAASMTLGVRNGPVDYTEALLVRTPDLEKMERAHTPATLTYIPDACQRVATLREAMNPHGE